ncbi:MAG: DNA repair protein RecO [Myxococcales bacterium]|nr:DNA repair protein RecO [Myxococcales bacterium]MCB9643003.1 DNA repair protein RecO [Myxococcales bacterium]
MQEERCEGILLQTRETGESDLIVTFWTDRFGRFAMRAPKARKSQKRFGGQLQSFARLQLAFQRAREQGRLPQLLRAEAVEGSAILPEALVAFAAASFTGELLLRMTDEEDANPNIYELYARFLTFCAEQPLTPKALARFELRLLELLGLLPSWTRCMECGTPFAPEESTRFDLLQGGLICGQCRSSREAPLILPATRSGLYALQTKTALPVETETWRDILNLLDRRLCHVLGYETRSRAFLAEVAGF